MADLVIDKDRNGSTAKMICRFWDSDDRW